jgi:GLPGLI family protein
MGFFNYHWHKFSSFKYLVMRLFFTALLFIGSSFIAINAQDGKLVSECTVFYTVTIEGAKADAGAAKPMEGTTKTVYIKGSKTRNDLESPGFRQTTIYDLKSDSTVVLREVGSAKYISYLDNNQRKEKNRKYEGIEFTVTNEKKTILGYGCIKVIAKLTDGSSFNVFYTPSIIPTNLQYEYQFKDLPGFVLEYEALTEDGKSKINYSATKITLVPVPVAKFDLPKTGYRVL